MGNTSREQSSNILNGVVLAQNSVSEKKMTLQDVLAEYAGLGIVVSLVIIFVLLLLVYSLSVSRKKQMEALKEAQNANAANIAKTTFLNHMSHDIRTPMNAVVGMTSIAEQNLSDPEKVKNCLAKIRLSSDHLLQLLNEVLDMSKIESGNTQLNIAPFHLHQLLEETEGIILQETEGKNQRLTVEIGQLIHDNVEGDMVRIRQILLNLLTNAVKYTPEHGTIRLIVNELLSSAVDAQKTITTNNSKITALEQPTEAQELQVAQSMVDVITQQLASIVSATRELDADCYAQRISRYLVFNGPESSFIKRYNIKPSVMLAALICTVWYLAAVVKMSCQRQRERLQAENE